MKAKAALGYILAYTMWIVSMLLTVVFLVLGRTTFPAAIGSMLTESAFGATQWTIAIDRLFTIIVGMGLIANMVIVESYFRTGVRRKDLFRRIARVFGILILLIFIADGMQQLMIVQFAVVWNRVLILLLELVAGLFLLIYSFKVKPPPKEIVDNFPVK